mmetsp:Transcript_8781/g.16701  ORF Transcript_8781/g.16701 Transcript_8781/m.16701 type:complete len:206 (+) Transcript_8781:34-651(+)
MAGLQWPAAGEGPLGPFNGADGGKGPAVVPQQQPQGLSKAAAKDRVDNAIRSMLQGYAAIIEAAKVAPRAEMATNAYGLRVKAAAMSRAAEDLLRVAGQVGGTKAITSQSSSDGQQQQQRNKHLRNANDISAKLQQLGATGHGWPLRTSLPAVGMADDSQSKAVFQATSQENRSVTRRRLLPPWMSNEAFSQGQGPVTVGGSQPA